MIVGARNQRNASKINAKSMLEKRMQKSLHFSAKLIQNGSQNRKNQEKWNQKRGPKIDAEKWPHARTRLEGRRCVAEHPQRLNLISSRLVFIFSHLFYSLLFSFILFYHFVWISFVFGFHLLHFLTPFFRSLRPILRLVPCFDAL